MPEPDLSLATYRGALAAWTAVIVLLGAPRAAGVRRPRVLGWCALIGATGLIIAFTLADLATDHWEPRGYAFPALLGLVGFIAIVDVGGFSWRESLRAWRATDRRTRLELLAAALRNAGWFCFLPSLASVAPWWFGMPKEAGGLVGPVQTNRSVGGFLAWFAFGCALLMAGGVVKALRYRRVPLAEALNRPIGQCLILAGALVGLAPAVLLVRPDAPAERQLWGLATAVGVASALAYWVLRRVRSHMALPERETPGLAWLRWRAFVAWRRRTWRPYLAMHDRGDTIVVNGDVDSVPSSAFRVAAYPRRLTIDIAEPTHPDAPYTGWTGMVMLPRDVVVGRVRAKLMGRELTVLAPTRETVELTRRGRPRKPRKRRTA